MTQPRKVGLVFRTCFGLNYLSLFTSRAEEFLSEDLPSDTGAQQRTTLSSRKKFFNPRTFGQGEDGKPLFALRNRIISTPAGRKPGELDS